MSSRRPTRSTAFSLLAEPGEVVTVLSGGMSLLPMMNLGLATPERVVSLNRVAALSSIMDDGASWSSGRGSGARSLPPTR